jgi:hypothetical protein
MEVDEVSGNVNRWNCDVSERRKTLEGEVEIC